MVSRKCVRCFGMSITLFFTGVCVFAFIRHQQRHAFVKNTLVASSLVRPRRHAASHKIAIFTTLSCTNAGANQITAVKSWANLNPKPLIFIFSECLPRQLKGIANLIREYDSTYDGMPLFGSMMHISQSKSIEHTADAIVWTNADIVLHDDLATGIETLFSALSGAGAWMGVVRRFNTEMLMDRQHARSTAKHNLGGYDLFVWNLPSLAPVRLPFPPFTRIANKWDNWLVTEASILRTVCDASKLITAQHVVHAYRDDTHVNKQTLHKTWQNINYGGWHNMHNRVVEHKFRRGHSDKLGTPDAVKMSIETDGTVQLSSHVLFVRSLLPANQPFYAFLNTADKHRTALFKTFTGNAVFTGGTGKFGTVILGFGCMFKKLNPHARLIIVAFDTDMYTQAYMQGYETFLMENNIAEMAQAQSYGSTKYKAITKMKTLAALHVLAQSDIHQYVWIDPDVAVFANVANHLFSMTADFIVQENSPTHLPVTKMKTNSGIYKINNVKWVRNMITEIINDGQNHGDSEQMSWNRVLCNVQSIKDRMCFWNTHKIHFLRRSEYATGHDMDAATIQLKNRAVPSNLKAWHNNWIQPFNAKMKRAKQLGLLHFDSDVGVCV